MKLPDNIFAKGIKLIVAVAFNFPAKRWREEMLNDTRNASVHKSFQSLAAAFPKPTTLVIEFRLSVVLSPSCKKTTASETNAQS